MTESPNTWGWVRCEKTLWVSENGARCYIGHFRQDNDLHSWTLCQVRFWAHHPYVAMRTIVQSGQNPADFADIYIN